MRGQDNELVILAIADRGLRSIWSARLGVTGENLIIVEDVDDGVLAAAAAGCATLIADMGIEPMQPKRRIAAIRARGWSQGVILLCDQARPDCSDARTVVVGFDSTTDDMLALLDNWRAVAD